MSANNNSTVGIIIGNRDFFPDKLVSEARTEILDLFKKLNITPVLLGEKDSKLG
jgi:L-fucose isomerase-like protein